MTDSARLIHRRGFLASSGLAAAALLAACGPRAARPDGRVQRASSFDELVDGLAGVADQMEAGGVTAEQLVERATAIGLRASDPHPIDLPVIDLSLYRDVIRTGVHHSARGITLIEWSLGPNAVYDAHNHPSYAGLSIGIAGQCRMRNFSPVSPAPGDGDATFTVVQTQDNQLRPGTVASTMTPTRDNIHKLHAGGAGVRGLDVAILLGEHTRFSFVDIDEASRDADNRFRARWMAS